MATVKKERPPTVIRPTAVYSRADLERLFRIGTEVLRAEIREGRLKVGWLGGRYVFLGQWVLDWIEACAVKGTHRPNHGDRNGAEEAGKARTGDRSGDC